MISMPVRLADKLGSEGTLRAAVDLTLSDFIPWMASSGMPFFPEYTDHGPGHVEGVVLTASSLVSDDAWEHVSSPDAAVLVIAAVLHDCAMHLTEDAFTQLIGGTWGGDPVEPDDAPWPAVWEEFLQRATRFDGRKLTQVFGDAEPVQRPPLDPEKMTRRDRRVIGEFLREQHGRLAHEIAILGVPAPGAEPLSLPDLPPDLPHLIGLVARSHGEPLRTSLGRLQRMETGNLRECRKVHAVFLMTLLRVADYLQMEAERAPTQTLKVRRLRSPISRGEWKAHHAITDIRHTHADPEAVEIEAEPVDAQTYFRIKEWLEGVQTELDTSWAVLGEVYGRYPPLDKLGMVVRRVRSNLDDEAGAGSGLPFHPVRASFQAAGSDLLKLLIEPLYEGERELGVRELVQNSVDAVRELQAYTADSPGLAEVGTAQLVGDVVVSFETRDDGSCWVTVADSGIGMTPEIVRDYFLKAGASFRRSDIWRHRFEEPAGEPKIVRSGYFGIGILAAFLLGDRAEVTTRHVDLPEDHGVDFVASLDTGLVELRKCTRPVGTSISVRTTAAVLEDILDSPHGTDFYCLDDVSVVRLDKREGTVRFQQAHTVPLGQEDLPTGWHRAWSPDFDDIVWTYSEAPYLVCNGMIVRRHTSPRYHLSESFSMPNVAVFDRRSRLPLNLRRTGLTTDEYPFHDVLEESVARALCAFALSTAPRQHIREADHFATSYRQSYVGSNASLGGLCLLPWACTGDGVCATGRWVVESADVESLLLVVEPYNKHWPFLAYLPEAMPHLVFVASQSFGLFDRSLGAPDAIAVFQSWLAVRRGVRGLRVFAPEDDLFGPQGAVRMLVPGSRTERLAGDHWTITSGDFSPGSVDIEASVARMLEELGEDAARTILIEATMDPPYQGAGDSRLARVWGEVFGGVFIPFEEGMRRRVFEGAVRELGPDLVPWGDERTE